VRKVRRRSAVDWDNAFLETIPDVDAPTPEQNGLDSQIVGAVQQLPEAQRVVMLLAPVEGLSYREAAEALDVPIGTVMSRLSRARQAIGAQFISKEKTPQASTGRSNALPNGPSQSCTLGQFKPTLRHQRRSAQ
jgi:RNA polymerase sigma-70 factor (ECF subfamily)